MDEDALVQQVVAESKRIRSHSIPSSSVHSAQTTASVWSRADAEARIAKRLQQLAAPSDCSFRALARNLVRSLRPDFRRHVCHTYGPALRLLDRIGARLCRLVRQVADNSDENATNVSPDTVRRLQTPGVQIAYQLRVLQSVRHAVLTEHAERPLGRRAEWLTRDFCRRVVGPLLQQTTSTEVSGFRIVLERIWLILHEHDETRKTNT